MKDQLLLSVKKVIPETEDTITLLLENTDGQAVIYEAGQFLTFIFDIHGRELRRSYSLSSSPGIDKDLAVTINRVQNGEISRYLFNHVFPGTIIRSLWPAGRFTIQSGRVQPCDIFLFGAGSGIVPLFSVLKTALKTEPESRVHLIYSNHNERSIIFRKQLEELQEIYKSRFNCQHLLSNPLSLLPGTIHAHLNAILLEELVIKSLYYEKYRSVFYVCGPFSYMRMIIITLPVIGFSQEQIYREVFVAEINESKPQIPVGNVDAKVRIFMQDKEHEILVPAGKTILRTALENGIKLPYSCEAGICSTCSAHCIYGNVEMSTNEVLTDKDISTGMVLTCTGYPVTGNVSIRF